MGRCRDPTIWAAAAKVLYETNITFPIGHPKKLQTIGFPTPGEVASDPVVAESDAIILKFLSQLEDYLSVEATALNYTALWDETKPDPGLPPLDILLNRTYPTLISKEETKNVRNPFYADYAAIHDGRRPAVDPVPLVWLDSQLSTSVEVGETNLSAGTLGIWRLAAGIRARRCDQQQDYLHGLVGLPYRHQ